MSKLHRARRRANRDQYRERFGNRAARAAKAPAERELEEKLKAARRQRDDLMASANDAYRKGVKVLEETRANDRQSAWADYEKAKDEALAEFAKTQEQAA